MPWGLKRYQQSGQTHFVTFSCFDRQPLLATSVARRIFERSLERVRRRFDLCIYGYVVMPEHIHLLLSEPGRATRPPGAPLKPAFGLSGPKQASLADAIKSLKQGVARRLIGSREHFWHKRYYDFNIRNRRQFVEKLRYIHRNPVTRGLCERPEEWEWSSFRQYAAGCEGRVEIECEWAALRRERAAGRLSPASPLTHSSQKRA